MLQALRAVSVENRLLNSARNYDELSVGAIFDEKFRIEKILGEGASGRVYQAVQIDNSRELAIKLLNAADLDDQDALLRFQREARILFELRHENIVAIYGYGIWKNECPYILLELLKGENLRKVLNREGRLNEKTVLAIGIQVAKALDHAHAADVVHRDIKPENIVILREQDQVQVKVLDFGLFKALNNPADSVQKLTQTGILIGSVNYMSPESCMGRSADKRSDIYSLACVLYELLTGQALFSSDNPIGLLFKHQNESPARMPVELGISSALELIVLKCLQKDPERRFQSAGELHDALVLVRDGKSNDLDFGTLILESHQSTAKHGRSIVLVCIGLLVMGGLILLYAANFVRKNHRRELNNEIQHGEKKTRKPVIAGSSPRWQLKEIISSRTIPIDKQMSELNNILKTSKSNELIYHAYRFKAQLCLIKGQTEELINSLLQSEKYLSLLGRRESLEFAELDAAYARELYKKKQYSEAKTRAENALRLVSDPETRVGATDLDFVQPGLVRTRGCANEVLGRICFDKGRYKEALKYCNDALSNSVLEVPQYVWKLSILDRIGSKKEINQALEEWAERTDNELASSGYLRYTLSVPGTGNLFHKTTIELCIYSYSAIADCYLTHANPALAKVYSEQAIKIAEKCNMPQLLTAYGTYDSLKKAKQELKIK